MRYKSNSYARRRKVNLRNSKRGYAYRDSNDPLRDSIALNDLKQLLVDVKEKNNVVIRSFNSTIAEIQELALMMGEIGSLPKEHGYSKLPDKRAPNLSAIYDVLSDSRVNRFWGSARHGEAQDLMEKFYELDDEIQNVANIVERLSRM